jgi:hypothetical protein
VRALILLLLLVNLVLFGWRQGGLGAVPTGREPQRLALQIAPDSIRLLSPAEFEARRSGQTGGDGGGSAGPRLACMEFGDFDEATLPRAQGRLAELALGERLRSRRIEATAWYVVFLPAAASRADAERTALELRNRGIRDLVVMGPNTPTPNAILLGSFRDPELAQRHQADLARRGVRGVQVTPRPAGGDSTRFEISDVDPALARQLAEIQKEFPQIRLAACGS